MSKSKNKIDIKLKKYNIFLIVTLLILLTLLSTIMITKIFSKEDYYKIVSRENNIKKSKENDNDYHETIGWIRVQGTNIDYPVFGVLKDEFDFPVVSPTYTWSLNMDSEFHNTMIIYGHNIMNLGPQPTLHDDTFERMEELMDFVYYDFAKENQYMQLTINGNNYIYKIFSVGFMPLRELDGYPPGEFNEATKNVFLNEIKEISIYDYDTKEITDSDKLLSVVTCSRFFTDGESYDFLVTGKLVNENEIEKSGVHKNKKYEQIEKILEGVKEDEKEIENS